MPAKPLIIANWKMNMSPQDEVATARTLSKLLKPLQEKVTIVLAPSFLAIEGASKALTKAPKCLTLGAQDCFWESKGAYTGEVSPVHLQTLGCTHVIVGHSERRAYLGETDAMIRRKLAALYTCPGITPILCVGESSRERKAGKTDAIIIRQVRLALSGLSIPPGGKLVIAYEPLWAIGTGVPATPEDCKKVSVSIRQELKKLFPKSLPQKNLLILYGGSVDSSNIKEFLTEGTADGALIGGASLDPRAFLTLIKKVSL